VTIYKKIGIERENVLSMYKRVTKSPSRLLRQNSEDLIDQHGKAELHKTDILGTARVLRKIRKYQIYFPSKC